MENWPNVTNWFNSRITVKIFKVLKNLTKVEKIAKYGHAASEVSEAKKILDLE